MGGHVGSVNLIAYDTDGHKFTNCSSLLLEFKYGDIQIATLASSSRSWTEIADFVGEDTEVEILKLRTRFDKNFGVHCKKSLPEESEASFDKTLELHNNFGICSSHEFKTNGEGVARLSVFLPVSNDQFTYGEEVESEELQIASFASPSTKSPNYKTFFDDITYVKSSQEQKREFHSQTPDSQFLMPFGSGLSWTIEGGTNYWNDNQFGLARKENGDARIEAELVTSNPLPTINSFDFHLPCPNDFT
jgi:hypothetical protein